MSLNKEKIYTHPRHLPRLGTLFLQEFRDHGSSKHAFRVPLKPSDTFPLHPFSSFTFPSHKNHYVTFPLDVALSLSADKLLRKKKTTETYYRDIFDNYCLDDYQSSEVDLTKTISNDAVRKCSAVLSGLYERHF